MQDAPRRSPDCRKRLFFISFPFSIVDAPVKMIVGLGNPGRTYEDTRHNAGFMVLDRLAARWGAVFKADRQRKCEVAAGPGVLLVKPSTFMNESGLCVGPMMRFFKLDPRSVFVIHDEVDFPLGVIKLREKAPQAATTA